MIDTDPLAIDNAAEAELPAIHGDATEADTLRAAGVDRAAVVIVASERDDTNVLIVLRAREINPRVTIIAACTAGSQRQPPEPLRRRHRDRLRRLRRPPARNGRVEPRRRPGHELTCCAPARAST